MITGKTIGQLTQLDTMTPDTLIPVEFSGSTYYVSHSILTSSSSFSNRISGLEIASGSFSTRVSDLKTDSGSFSTRSTALETASGSFSTRVTNLVSDSSSFSNRITYFTGSVFGTSSKVVNGVYTTDTGSVSNNMLAGSISNSKLINGSILIGSSSVSLGATASSFTGLDSVSANSITVAGQPTTYGTVNPAYIVVGLVNSVNLFGTSQTFVLDTILSNTNSQVSYNTSSGVFTLTAGVTYDMSFTPSFITFSNTTGGFLCYQWVDATTNTPLDSTGTGTGTALPSTETGGQVDNLTARVIYTPSTNQTVKLYTTSVNGTATLRGALGTQAIIKPMNISIAVQATATGTINNQYISVTNISNQEGSYGVKDIALDTVLSSNGIAYNTSTGVYTLTSGVTYRITSTIGFYNATPGYLLMSWVDATSNTAINSVTQTIANNNWPTGQIDPLTMDFVYTPVTNQTVKLRTTSTSNNTFSLIGGGDSKVVIQQINNAFALNALDTMTLTGAISASGNITGNTLISSAAGGNEGGEIQLAKSPNSTLSGSNVVIDQYVDRIRIFEAGGSTRGAYIDLTQAAGGVGTLLNNRVSGFVNAGTFVTMDNLKVTVTTSGNRGLSVGAVSTSFTANIAGHFFMTGAASGGAAANAVAYTTTAATSAFGWNFGGTGDTSVYVITDTTNSRCYRVTMQIATGFNNNLICIERLV